MALGILGAGVGGSGTMGSDTDEGVTSSLVASGGGIDADGIIGGCN